MSASRSSFSFAVAALIDGRIDAAWARWVRPWTLVAWMFLTLGIAMGSYWAYYELGWGGWWFWDPVENASLMPWLAGTALLHSAVVMEKRDALKIWTMLLAILTFSLSLLGTFLVRSGVLTSVHAFATDPTRGVFILAILVPVHRRRAGAVRLARADACGRAACSRRSSREGALVLNNLFLTTACATVFVGTLYPLALEALTGDKISVGAPFFNLTFVPLIVPLLLVVPFGPLLAWKRGDLLRRGAAADGRLRVRRSSASRSLSCAGRRRPVLAPLGIGLALWLIVGALERARRPHRRRRVAARRSRCRAPAGLPRSACGTALAHAGLGVTRARHRRRDAPGASSASPRMKPGDSDRASRGYALHLRRRRDRAPGRTTARRRAHFIGARGGDEVGDAAAVASALLPRAAVPTTEAGILTRGF